MDNNDAGRAGNVVAEVGAARKEILREMKLKTRLEPLTKFYGLWAGCNGDVFKSFSGMRSHLINMKLNWLLSCQLG